MDTLARVAPESIFAAQACDAIEQRFEDVFKRHFVVSPDPLKLPDSWQVHSLNGFEVAWCPDLPCARLTDSAGNVLALVLGIAVAADGQYVENDHVIGGEESELVDVIEGMAGRYVVISHGSVGPRIYVDPSQSLVVYYSSETRRAGSALALVLDRPPEREAPEDGPLLFGDTADRAVKRITTNHFLDLNSFQETRHWPRDDTDISIPEDFGSHLDGMVGRLSTIVGALSRRWRTILPVTGGTDSRFLLAATKPHLEHVNCFFTHVQNGPSFLDTMVAAAVCERMGLPHTSIAVRNENWRHAEETVLLEKRLDLSGSYQLKTGRHVIAAALAAGRHGDLMLRGGLIELTRTNTWKVAWGDTPHEPIDPVLGMQAVCHAMDVSTAYIDEQSQRYSSWMQTLPSHVLGRAPDFAVCEQRVPTGNHVFYAAFPDPFLINPFSDRGLIHATTRLPYRFRRNRRPQNYVIRNFARELNGLPYASKALKDAVDSTGLVQILGRDWR